MHRVEHVLLLLYGAGDRPVRGPGLRSLVFRASFSPR
jgi:hypothetical protein